MRGYGVFFLALAATMLAGSVTLGSVFSAWWEMQLLAMGGVVYGAYLVFYAMSILASDAP